MSRGAWIGVGVFAACLLPAWAVKSASQQSRMIWVGAVLFLAFLGLIGSLIQQASSRVGNAPVPYLFQKRSIGFAVGLSFLFAELSAIMITYADGDSGFVGKLGLLLSQTGTMLFPVVGRYATELSPSLSPQALLKTQGIVSAFLLAGLLSAVAILISLFRMSRAERRVIYEQNPQYPPSLIVVVALPFGILMALSAYFGWGEFSGPTADRCFIKATCYAYGNDLGLLAASIMKTMVVFGFPLGTLLCLDMKRVHNDTQ